MVNTIVLADLKIFSPKSLFKNLHFLLFFIDLAHFIEIILYNIKLISIHITFKEIIIFQILKRILIEK